MTRSGGHNTETRGGEDITALFRRDLHAPDLTDTILGEVAHRRRFLKRRERAKVRSTRYALAACGLALLSGVAIVHRLSPDALRLTPIDAPVATLAEAVETDRAASEQRLAHAAREVRGLTDSLLGSGSLGLSPSVADIEARARAASSPRIMAGGSGLDDGLEFTFPASPPMLITGPMLAADLRALIEHPLVASQVRLTEEGSEADLLLDDERARLLRRAPSIDLPDLWSESTPAGTPRQP